MPFNASTFAGTIFGSVSDEKWGGKEKKEKAKREEAREAHLDKLSDPYSYTFSDTITSNNIPSSYISGGTTSGSSWHYKTDPYGGMQPYNPYDPYAPNPYTPTPAPLPSIPTIEGIEAEIKRLQETLALLKAQELEAKGRECPQCEERTVEWSGDDYICDNCRGF